MTPPASLLAPDQRPPATSLASRPGPAQDSGLDRWGIDDADVHAWQVACLKANAEDPAGILAGTLAEAEELLGVFPQGVARRWVQYATEYKVFHPVGRTMPHVVGFRFLGGLTPLCLVARIDPARVRAWSGPKTVNDLAATVSNQGFVIERLAAKARAHGWAITQTYGAWSVHRPTVK